MTSSCQATRASAYTGSVGEYGRYEE